jgi:hypothetical protein
VTGKQPGRLSPHCCYQRAKRDTLQDSDALYEIGQHEILLRDSADIVAGQFYISVLNFPDTLDEELNYFLGHPP